MASVKNYTDPGGATTHIAGDLQVESGGSLTLESGSTLTLNGSDISDTELGYLDGVTAGAVTASKAVVAGATKNLDTLLIDAATLAATGNSQGTAAAVTADTTYVTGADNTTAVVLPTAVSGRRLIVVNTVANKTLPVYPATGAAINALGANAAYTMPYAGNAVFVATSATQWYGFALPGGVTATAAELNTVAGVTAGTVTAGKAVVTTTDKHIDALVISDGGLALGAGAGTAITATAAEVNKLDGAPLAASFVIGAEGGGNIINVAIQLQDGNAADLAVRGAVKAYLSDDANGDSVCAVAPTGGTAIGTDGVLIADTPALANSLLVDGNLAIDAVPEKFKTTQTAAVLINGICVTKAGTTALTFTAAHVITAAKFGVILIQMNAAGTISTKVPGSPQAYDDAPTALAALPAADAGNVALGYIAIENNAGDWTANTDDLTNGSDLTTAAFNDATEVTTTAPKSFTLVSESDGDIDLDITESGVKTYYLVLVLPSGKLAPSGAIAFT